MRPPDSWARARITLVITLVTGAAWLLATLLNLEAYAAIYGGFIPGRVALEGGDPIPVPWWITPLTATLVHGDFFHVALNLLFLVVCGRPTEGVLGAPAIAILYLVGAYAAAVALYFVDPASIVPMIGASGAISAVIGAYAILFGRNKVKVANPTLALWLNALWLMAAWVGLQLLWGLATASMGLSVAISAHIGGFLVGLALANPLLLFRYRKA